MKDQHVTRRLNRRAFDVRPDEKRASLDPFLPPGRLVFVETGMLQRPRNAACEMSCGFPDRRSEGTVGNDWSDTGHEYTNRSNQMRAQLTETRRRRRILDFRSRRCPGCLCKRAFLIMRSRNDRNPLARNAKLPQISRRIGGGSGIFKERHYEGVGHRENYSNAKCKMQNANTAECKQNPLPVADERYLHFAICISY
jgi:hypothetical protein